MSDTDRTPLLAAPSTKGPAVSRANSRRESRNSKLSHSGSGSRQSRSVRESREAQARKPSTRYSQPLLDPEPTGLYLSPSMYEDNQSLLFEQDGQQASRSSQQKFNAAAGTPTAAESVSGFGGTGATTTTGDFYTSPEQSSPLLIPPHSEGEHTNVENVDIAKGKTAWTGVFLPVSISIFGAVMFIRLPFVVGEAGFLLTLVGIFIVYAVAALTIISIAAISTNGFVGDGGPYMLISRNLGAQFGLTVSFLFLAGSLISSAMYLIGGSELVMETSGLNTTTTFHLQEPWVFLLVACSAVLVVIVVIALLKMDTVFRGICFLLSMIAFGDLLVNVIFQRKLNKAHVGISEETWNNNLWPDFSEGSGFQEVLALLFPGVTGLMSGVAYTAELKFGGASIAKGLTIAWVSSFVTYILITAALCSSFDRDVLRKQYRAMSFGGDQFVFTPGEFCAGFAAAISGLSISARMIRAIANDGILKSRFLRFFRGSSLKKSVIFCYVLIELILIPADLSYYYLMSRSATVVFGATFFALNFATFLPSVSGIPSFRPTHSFYNKSGFSSLLGAIASLGLIFYVWPIPSLILCVLMITLFIFVDAAIEAKRVPWGDPSQPFVFWLVRKWLLKLNERRTVARNWRPSILHFVCDPELSMNLMHFASNLKKGGLYQIGLLVDGDYSTTMRTCFVWKNWLLEFIEASGIKGFPYVSFDRTLREGIQHMVRGSGLGGMRPNVVLLSLDEMIVHGEVPLEYLKPCKERRKRGSDSFRNNGTDTISSNSKLRLLKNPLDSPTTQQKKSSPITSTGRLEDSVESKRNFFFTSSHDGDSPLKGSSGRSLDSNGKKKKNSKQKDNTNNSARKSSLPATGSTHRLEDGDSAEESDSGSSSSARFGGIYRKTGNNHHYTPLLKKLEGKFRTGKDCDLDAEDRLLLRLGKGRASMGLDPTFSSSGSDSSGESEGESDGTGFNSSLENSLRGRHESVETPSTPTSTDDSASGGRVLCKDKKRKKKRNKIAPGLHAWDSLPEFVRSVSDICQLDQMTVALARNFNKLDKQAIADSEEKVWIDVWLPRENDPVPVLLAHCLSLTSVWKNHARVRLVDVVVSRGEMLDAAQTLEAMLLEHRLVNYDVATKIVAIEDELELLGFYDPSTVGVPAARGGGMNLADALQAAESAISASPQSRATVINQLIKKHSSIEPGTALVVVRHLQPIPCAAIQRLKILESAGFLAKKKNKKRHSGLSDRSMDEFSGGGGGGSDRKLEENDSKTDPVKYPPMQSNHHFNQTSPHNLGQDLVSQMYLSPYYGATAGDGGVSAVNPKNTGKQQQQHGVGGGESSSGNAFFQEGASPFGGAWRGIAATESEIISDDSAEAFARDAAWMDSLEKTTAGLPPTLAIVGFPMRYKSNDW